MNRSHSLRYRFKKLALLSISISFSALTTASFAGVSFEHLQANVGFANVGIAATDTDGVNPIRLQAIKQAATTLAARGALAWRSVQINHSLDLSSKKLSRIFNFNRLILNQDVLPPIIVQANSSLKLSGTQVFRTDSKTYQIISAARFVSTPPTWRNYLYMNFCKPSLPDRSLLPTSKAEARVWNLYFKQGWKEGLDQANSIFAANLARLKRDFTGMITFRKLLSEKMVNAPFVAESHLGVTGNANELRINDRVMRITNPSKLQVDSNQWKPIFTG